MTKLTALMFAAALCVSVVLIGSLTANANTPSFGKAAGQVVTTTKRVTRKSYRKGKHVTITTVHHSRRIGKKTWHKGHHVGKKVVVKTKRVVVGPRRRRP